MDQWSSVVQAIAALVQAITATIIVYLTRRLVRATDTYAQLTKSAVDLSTKQYEGDVSPMWHLTLFTSGSADNEVWFKILNLSKNSAIITYLLIRVDSENEEEPNKFVLNIGMPGLRENMSNVRQFILKSLEPHIVDGEWTGTVEISVVFTLKDSPAQIPSQPFRFKIAVRDSRITSVQPRLAAITLEPRKVNSQ